MAWLWTFCLSVSLFASAGASAMDFRKEALKIGQQNITVEIAETPEQQEHGLMFRKNLSDKEGMLFVFDDEEIRRFWMKNTLIDLAIGYFDRQKKLIDIQEMKAVGSVMEANPPAYPSRGPAMYALEVPSGWFKKHGIKEGSTFVLESSVKSKNSRRKSGR